MGTDVEEVSDVLDEDVSVALDISCAEDGRRVGTISRVYARAMLMPAPISASFASLSSSSCATPSSNSRASIRPHAVLRRTTC